MSNTMIQETKNDWLKMEDFTEVIKATMSNGTIRKILLHRKENGADYFVRKIGKRLFLSPSKFYEWIEGDGNP